MHAKENRAFPNDSWTIAVARVVFVKWMKTRNFWQGYKSNLRNNCGYKELSWIRPSSITDFLGRCSYEYGKAYKPWCKYCSEELDKQIKDLQNEYAEALKGY
jgi:hypothetical protein